jgi:hypothetical protein
MRKSAVLLVLAVTMAAGAARASDAALAKQFGLPGEWALDCTLSASPANMHQAFVLKPDGAVSGIVYVGPTYPPEYQKLTDLKQADAATLIVTFTRESDGHKSRVTLKKSGNKMHAWDSTDIGTNVPLIREAMFVHAKRPVPWITKCGK